MKPIRRLLWAAASALFLASTGATAQAEPYDTGWALYFDNDLLAPRRTDRDYTGGFSLTLAGRRAREAWWSIDAGRAGLERILGLERLHADRAFSRHSMESGATVFTPGDLSAATPQPGERPYASLIYLANTGVNVVPGRDTAYVSTFTLGVLGAPIVGDLQRALHRATGSAEPLGWDNQISNGGEPTLRFAFARVRRAWQGALAGIPGELTTTWRGSVGYLTEASFSVATRFGDIRTPWWSYNPQIADYAEKSVPVVASEGGGGERYVWGGFTVRARAYNAFLQGQFRDSAVTFSADELNPVTLEAWIGYTHALESGWRLSYVLRGHSSEIRDGPADRQEVWGGIIVSHALD